MFIWYPNNDGYTAHSIRDIYNIILHTSLFTYGNTLWFQLRLEYKYRYSGLLFDKLKCLFSYVCNNVEYTLIVPNLDVIKTCRTVNRFMPQNMYPTDIKTFSTKDTYRLNEIDFINNIYFVNN